MVGSQGIFPFLCHVTGLEMGLLNKSFICQNPMSLPDCMVLHFQKMTFSKFHSLCPTSTHVYTRKHTKLMTTFSRFQSPSTTYSKIPEHFKEESENYSEINLISKAENELSYTKI